MPVPHRFWHPPANPPAAARADDISRWEAELGASFPAALREAYLVQNGGLLHSSVLELFPLEEMGPADEDVWEYVEVNASESEPDWTDPERRARLFVFARGEYDDLYLLDFGAEGESAVYVCSNDTLELTRCAESLATFLAAELAADPAPAVDWSETERLPVLARESIDLQLLEKIQARTEQVLCRDGELLVSFYRTWGEDTDETIERTALPLPISADAATIQPFRTSKPGTFILNIDSSSERDGEHITCTQTCDGLWRNRTEHAPSLCTAFESPDREKLRQLRLQLVGLGRG